MAGLTTEVISNIFNGNAGYRQHKHNYRFDTYVNLDEHFGDDSKLHWILPQEVFFQS